MTFTVSLPTQKIIQSRCVFNVTVKLLSMISWLWAIVCELLSVVGTPAYKWPSRITTGVKLLISA